MMMSCARGSAELLGLDDSSAGNGSRTGQDPDGDYSTTDHNNTSTGHVSRERSGNVTPSPRPSGPSKSAPVRRRAARLGKLKQHKHFLEA
ncbi:unnamed protein product [Echinostoma caproni]|uniref:BHLH domain-containing protein n=1 Tax=Echinostoma caproni TaxID=27848 RepID=A0A183BCX7_9TREM|nr:unnamed protein product [Echinostoma caproni]